ncbi:alginate export family protein [Novosphingobium rosa]|uniref:alginate export family protein n=1 Tax=Novosphingobium rosa TaxID=76978 RepID=UPI000829B515|nr:alginate export family protein [Novosphingobium rosa]
MYVNRLVLAGVAGAVAGLSTPAAASAPDSDAPPRIATPQIVTPDPRGANLAVLFPASPRKPDSPKGEYDIYWPRGGGWGPYQGGGYWMSRYMEDWRNVPRHKGDIFNILKEIPLTRGGVVRLSLNGTMRNWIDYQNNPGLKSTGYQTTVLQRTIAGARVDLGDLFTAYAEVANGLASGHNFNKIPTNQQKDATILQAFGEVHGKALKGYLGLRVGRQDFWDGPLQLATVRENPNIRQMWNGVRAFGLWKDVRVDVFHLYGTTLNDGAFNDPVNHAERLDGAVLGTHIDTGHVGKVKTTLFLDGIYYHYGLNRSWGQTSGRDDRDIYGAYLHGDIGRMALDWSAFRQTGSFAGRAVSAYAVFTKASYLLATSPLQPRIGFRADVASGGGAYGKGTLHDFNFMHGITILTTSNNYLVYTNAVFVGPQASIQPTPRLNLSTEYSHVWRMDDHDAVYNGGTSLAYAGTQNVRGSTVGDIWRAKMDLKLNRHLNWQVNFDRIFAGSVLTRAGFRNESYINSIVTFKF